MSQDSVSLAMLVTAYDKASGVLGGVGKSLDDMAAKLRGTGVASSEMALSSEAASARAVLASRAHQQAVNDLMAAESNAKTVAADIANGAAVSSQKEAAALSTLQSAQRAESTAAKESTAAQKEQAAASGVSSGGFGKIAIAAAGAVVGLGLFADHAIKDAVSFQKAMELSVTQAGMTEKAADSMGKRLIALGPQVGQSSQAMADAFYHVASVATTMGLTADQQFDLMKTAAEGAAVGHSDLTTTTNALIGAVTSGIPGVQNYTSAMGTMNAIVGAGNMKMQDLTLAFGTGALGTMAAYGVSLQSVGAVLAYMTSTGVSADSAMTRLKMSVALLGGPTKQSAKILGDLGVSQSEIATRSKAMSDALLKSGVTSSQLAGDLKKPDGIVVALQDLKKHMDDAGISATDQAAIITRAFGGGKMGGTILQLYQNLDKLPNTFNQIGATAGQFGDAWTKTQGTAAFQGEKLRASFNAISTSIGMALLPMVQKLLTVVLAIITPITNWIAKHQTLATGIFLLAGGLALLVVAVWAVTAAMGALTAVLGVIGLLLSPITLAVLAFAAAGYLIVTHWTAVKEFLKRFWPEIVAVFTGGLSLIVMNIIKYHQQIWEFIQRIWHDITGFLTGIWHGLVDAWNATGGKLIHAISTAFDGLKAIFGKAWSEIRDNVLGKAWKGLEGVWNATGGKAVSAISKAWQSTSKAWDDEWAKAKPKLESIWNSLSSIWDSTGGKAVSWIDHTFDNTFGGWSGVWNMIRTGLMLLWDGLKAAWDNTGGKLVTIIQHVWDFIATAWTTAWGLIKSAFQAFWSAIEPIVSGAMAIITAVVTGGMQIIGAAIRITMAVIISIFQGTWDVIKLIVQTAWHIITGIIQVALDVIQGILTFFADLFKGKWGALWNDVTSTLSRVWHTITSTITAVVNGIVSFLTSAWNLIRSVTSAIWNGILSMLSSIWNTLRSIASSAFNAIASVISSVWNTVRSVTSSIWSGITSTLSSVWNGIRSTASSVWNGIVNAIQSAWNRIQDVVKAPLRVVVSVVNLFIGGADAVLSAVGLGSPIPRIPGFASGGVLPGYAPGRDSVLAMLSPGEGILTPQTVRALGGKAGISALNTLGAAGFADGGVVSGAQHFAGGGVAARAISSFSIPNPIGGAWDALKTAFNATKHWVRGMLSQAAAAALTPLRAGLNAVPGTGMFHNMPIAAANKAFDGIIAWIKGQDQAHGVSAAAQAAALAAKAVASGAAGAAAAAAAAAVPHHATGGIVAAGGPSYIGYERGTWDTGPIAHMAMVHPHEAIIPASMNNRGLGGDVHNHFHFDGMYIGSAMDELMRQIDAEFVQKHVPGAGHQMRS